MSLAEYERLIAQEMQDKAQEFEVPEEGLAGLADHPNGRRKGG